MALPRVVVPFELREVYETRVKQFFEENGKEKIERYVHEVGEKLGLEFELNWTEDGLANISLGTCGFDLVDKERFQGHNMEYLPLEQTLALMIIAQKYISRLLE